MTLYLVAGGSGSGKTTVGQVLRESGQNVLDADQDSELSCYVNKLTGLRVTDLPPFPHSEAWLKGHSWEWDKERLAEIEAQYNDSECFVCGGCSKIDNFYSFFRLRFLLWVDRETTTNRLLQREPQRWNPEAPELHRVLKVNDTLRRWAIDQGFTILIGSLPPQEIAGDILAYVNRAVSGPDQEVR